MKHLKTYISVLLDVPFIYNFFQTIVGTNRVKSEVMKSLSLSRHDRVLDFGCGTGKYATGFSGSYYLGIDPIKSCIEVAKRKHSYNQNIFFEVGDERMLSNFRDGEFNFVFGIGVLHHMEDFQIYELSKQLHRILTKRGSAVFWEPNVYNGQPLLTKLIISMDRGQKARSESGYLHFFESSFNICTTRWTKLLRIPYDHVVIQLKKK